MAITVPWTAALGKDDDKRDVEIVAGGDPSYVIDKLAFHLGANVILNKRQEIYGALECLRRWLLTYMQSPAYTGTSGFVKAPWDNAKDSTTYWSQGAPTEDEIALVVHAGFVGGVGSTGTGSHFYNETSRQLGQVFLEMTKDQP